MESGSGPTGTSNIRLYLSGHWKHFFFNALHQRDRFVGNFLGNLFIFRLSDNRKPAKGELSIEKLASPAAAFSPKILCRASCNLSSDDSVQISIFHELKILIRIIIKQEHVAARLNRARNQFASLHPARDSHHVRCIDTIRPLNPSFPRNKSVRISLHRVAGNKSLSSISGLKYF